MIREPKERSLQDPSVIVMREDLKSDLLSLVIFSLYLVKNHHFRRTAMEARI